MHHPQDIETLVPHSGTMCLLERIEVLEEDRVVCRTTSHRSQANPLRRDGRLSAVHSVEYGAQAIAVHRSLRADPGSRVPELGFLASLKEITFGVSYIEGFDVELKVEARRLLEFGDGAIYRFAVHAGAKQICLGRASVIRARVGP